MLVPESHYKSQWTFGKGVLTASPVWDSVVTPDAYQDFRLHVEFNVNDAGDVEREKNGNSGLYSAAVRTADSPDPVNVDGIDAALLEKIKPFLSI